jgi:transcriptional regulator with XRE-family HTH domain
MLQGEKIRYYRHKKGMTQEELCRGICSPTYLSKLENNKIEPREDILQLLCERLNISIEYLRDIQTSKYKKDLFDWYELIKRRDRLAAKQKYEAIEALVKENEEDDELQWLYKLFLLRYSLFIKNEKQSSKLAEEVMNHEKYYHQEVIQLYYNFLGYYFYSNDFFEKALLFYTKAVDLGHLNNYVDSELIYNLSMVQSKLGRYSISIINANKALEIFFEEMKINRAIDCYILLGINFSHIREYNLAEKNLLKALHHAAYHDDPFILSTIYQYLGYIESCKGNSADAIHLYENSIRTSSSIRISTIYLLAYEYYLLGEHNKSMELVSKGLFASEKENEFSIKLKVLEYKLKGLTDSLEYINYLKKGISFFIDKEDRVNVCFLAELIARYYQDIFQYKKACKYYALMNNIRDKD